MMDHQKATSEKQTRLEEQLIWQNIRKTGRLTCHRVSIPSTCSVGKCDSYPFVFICKVCNPCPCVSERQ